MKMKVTHRHQGTWNPFWIGSVGHLTGEGGLVLTEMSSPVPDILLMKCKCPNLDRTFYQLVNVFSG